MIERLRSHLRKTKGFTLIELLVVIAIIAILMVIVLFAINPVARIRDANDRRASSDVTNLTKGMAACVTDQLGKGNTSAVVYTDPHAAGVWAAAAHADSVRQCGTRADLQDGGYIQNIAAALPGANGDNIFLAATGDAFCVVERGGSTGGTVHHWALNSTGTAVWTFGGGVQTMVDGTAWNATQQGGQSILINTTTTTDVPTGC